MGFNIDKAKDALSKTGNDIYLALDFLKEEKDKNKKIKTDHI